MWDSQRCGLRIHVCVVVVQGNKVPLHRDHNWDIFGVLLGDEEVGLVGLLLLLLAEHCLFFFIFPSRPSRLHCGCLLKR